MSLQRIIIDDDDDLWFENANGKYVYYSGVWGADPRRSPHLARVADATSLSTIEGLTAREVEKSFGIRERFTRRTNAYRE